MKDNSYMPLCKCANSTVKKLNLENAIHKEKSSAKTQAELPNNEKRVDQKYVQKYD